MCVRALARGARLCLGVIDTGRLPFRFLHVTVCFGP